MDIVWALMIYSALHALRYVVDTINKNYARRLNLFVVAFGFWACWEVVIGT